MIKMKSIIKYSAFLLFLGILFLTSKKQAFAKPGDTYSAEKAVKYADSCFKKVNNKYKKNPSKKYGEELCAGYVSQCLKEGGMSMDSKWYWKGIGKTSDAWRISKTMFRYLKGSGYKVNYSPNASDIKKGDVIFYWTNGGWGHVAICVGKTSSGKPMINAYNEPHYHFSYWTLGYKTCLISMDSKTATPDIDETVIKNGKEINISCEDKNAKIYYTTDGKKPTSSSKKYTKAFSLKKNATVKALAVYSDYKPSNIASKAIDIHKTLSDGIYYLKTIHSDKMGLGISNSSKKENTPVSLLTSNPQYNCKLSIAYKKNGQYSFKFLHSGYALAETPESKTSSISSDTTANNNSTHSTTKKANTKFHLVHQMKSSDQKSQLWSPKYISKNHYQITNIQTKNYLSIGSSIKTGALAYTTNSQEKYGQTWNFVATSRSKLKTEKNSNISLFISGKKYVLPGCIVSNYNIESVSVKLLSITGKTMKQASCSPKAKKYSLSNLLKDISFKKITAGIYTLRITAYDSTKQTKTLLNQKVTIR